MSKEYDAFEMYCFAAIYQDAAAEVQASMYQKHFTEDRNGIVSKHDREARMIIPSAVLMCLSLEIFLKCIFVIEGQQFEWVHDPQQLLGELPEEEQVAIRRLFTELGKDAIAHREMPLESVLERMKDYFKKGKYCFDKPKAERLPSCANYRKPEEEVADDQSEAEEVLTNEPIPDKTRGFFGLSRAVNAVRSRILEIKPDWEERYQQRDSFY